MKVSTEKPARTWQEVADILGVSRQHLSKWRKLEGAPKTKLISEWQEFRVARDLGVVKNRPQESREFYLTQKAQRDVELQDIKIAQARRELISTVEAKAAVQTMLAIQKTGYRKLMQRYANRFGLSIDEQQEAAKWWDNAETEMVKAVEELRL